MSKLVFKHDAGSYLEALGLPKETSPESIDKGFQAFISIFAKKSKVSERMEFLLNNIDDPNILITVYHMIVHCLMQSQVAQQKVIEAEKEESPILLPETPKIIVPANDATPKETIVY